MKKKQLKENKPSSNKHISSSTKLPAINNKKSPSSASQNISLNIPTYQDQGLVTLIQEYLLKNNLFDTLQIFQKDCIKGFKQSIKSIQTLKKQLLQSFDTGNRDAFLSKFTQYVPLSMRTKDNKTLKMQFYLQLYFFIYAIHPFLGKKKALDLTAKQNFVSYLQGRGAILSKQQQFLPFYALAYLQKPQQHQTFKSMFTKQWIQDLRKQFILYIDKLYPPTKTPAIVNIYDKFIQLNLQGEKYSSVALTQPNEEYEQSPIQQQIEQNYEQSIMNNPQPVLLQNNNNGLYRVMNNNSMERLQSLNRPYTTNMNKAESPNISANKEQVVVLNQQLKQLQQQKDQIVQYMENYKKKYQNLQNDFKQFSQSIKTILQQSQNKWFRIIQQLYNVAVDLLNASINLQKGVPLTDPNILVKRGQKLQRYKGFVSMNIQDLLSDNVADYSLFQRPEHDLSVDMVKKNTEYFEKQTKFIQLDFSKIKSVLGTVPDNQMSQQDIKQLNIEKKLILQALRQRFITMRGAFQKRQVVLSYTIFDVLGITEAKQKEAKGQKSIINILLDPNNAQIMLQTTLFIEALCKDYYGRQYLFDQKLMIKMMDLRKNPFVDQKIKQIILIIFQLQSNKKSCQIVMIDNGLIQQIVQKLDQQRDQMRPISMEYATALLLNLLLSKKGIDRAQRIKSEILMTLINLMQTQNNQVKNFVHASLYPLLARKTFREKALQFGMQANIKYLLENGPSVQFQHQLNYVYNRLMMQQDEQQEKDDEPEYDQINDDQIGDEIPFPMEEVNNAISGQFFLMKKYALTGPDAMQQMVKIKQEVKITFSKQIYYDRQTVQRYSVQTPLLGKGRKSQIHPQKGGFTHNHSQYSNRSSHRVLRSEKNSRIKNPKIKSSQKQRLDTVHQNGSEASLKEFRQHSKGQVREKKNTINSPKQNNPFELQKRVNTQKNDEFIEIENAEGTFRQFSKQESPLKESLMKELNSIQINEHTKIVNNESISMKKQNNQSITQKLDKQNEEEANFRNKKLKPYQQNQQYMSAFQTRARLIRTPPQKPS